ncbi:hypothetical protein [Actinomadura rubrisoli]|uniref:Uncharacterized protein n=1 Tax=Actinomadura rubrisoli TaxID=2530368 RepID=A0A4R5BY29_9ACTN|nr:hypothetical protein [Actinomadura rubrisoli]TDD90756.1 hypothetical protein E1298_12705 [Actinomadura rubrisoli]
MPEDDFGLWERELEPGPPDEGASGGFGMVLVAGLTASGCTAMIALGEVPLGTAGLVLSSIILLLWRIGM